MDNLLLCRVCGEGPAALRRDTDVVGYRGQSVTVVLQIHACAHCGSEYADAQDALANKRAVMGLHKRIDGLLAGDEIRTIRRQYRINQTQAATLFGGGPVAFSKYENDDVSHSASMDKLLRLARASDSVFWALAEQAGLTHELTQQRDKVVRKSQTTTTNVIALTFGSLNEFKPIDGTRRVVTDQSLGDKIWK